MILFIEVEGFGRSWFRHSFSFLFVSFRFVFGGLFAFSFVAFFFERVGAWCKIDRWMDGWIDEVGGMCDSWKRVNGWMEV